MNFMSFFKILNINFKKISFIIFIIIIFYKIFIKLRRIFHPLKIIYTARKSYFRSPGVSWKAQKDQVTTIFPSTFWLKKKLYSPSLKSSKNKNFLVISKHDFSINVLAQKTPYFSFPKSSKQEPFSNK